MPICVCTSVRFCMSTKSTYTNEIAKHFIEHELNNPKLRMIFFINYKAFAYFPGAHRPT